MRALGERVPALVARRARDAALEAEAHPVRLLRPLVGDLDEEELAFGGLLPLRPGIVYQPPALARLLGEVLVLDVPCRLAVDGMANGSRT